MSCPSELTLSIYADGELEAAPAARLERHLDGCTECAERLAGLRREAELLRAALALPALVGERRPHTAPLRLLAATAGAMGLAVGLRAAATLAAGALAWLPDWLNPLELAGALNLLLSSIFFVATPGGGTMDWSATWIFSVTAALAAGLTLTLALRRPRAPVRIVALMPLLAAVLAAPAGAVELRNGDTVVLAADEVIEGSLVLAGETVRVDGTVNGDVVAFARKVTVRGPVSGGVYAFAQNVDFESDAGGSLHLFAQWVRVAGTAAGNGYMFAQGVDLLPGSRVDGDVMMFGETLAAEGSVGRDLVACGARADLRGEVAGNAETWTDELELADGAALGGNLVAHLPFERELVIPDGASVGGEVSVERAEPEVRESRYRKPGFYLWKLVGLVGAFLVGAVLWWLAPGLLGGRLDGSGVLPRLGIGLLVLVATPVVLLVIGVTLIGLPLALIGLVLYLVAVYLAKILTADLLGRALLSWPEETPRRALPALALGLAILTVVGILPWIGGLIGFLVVLLGLGLLSYRLWSRRSVPPPAVG